MKKISMVLGALILGAASVKAQKVTTKAIDNKGNIKWVLDSSTAVITKADSTILYVTPTQFNEAVGNAITSADNGVTKVGNTVKLGGELTETVTIETSPTAFFQLTGLQSGSATDSLLVMDPSSGRVRVISSAALIAQYTASNGITKVGNNFQLGGTLASPTTITTSATNTLKVAGLESGDISVDSLVVASADGTLKRVSASSIAPLSGENSFTATPGQLIYSVPGLPAGASKVNVYRNGAKLVRGAGGSTTADYTVSAGQVNLVLNGYTIENGDVIEIQWVR